MTDDDQLMIRVQEGEVLAFNELVMRYEGPLIGFFLRNTRDRYLAEDLAQETFLRMYEKAWDYLPCGRFRGWMFRIARNLRIDDHRRRSHDALIRAVRGQADDDDDALARIVCELLPPEERASHREVAGLIDALLQEIPDDQRETFTLHHYSGLPLAEVAEITETNLATCKSRLRLAREKLSTLMKRRGVTPSATSSAPES
jgi:RNA polymerase sigma-70 factor, ECF subfamily